MCLCCRAAAVEKSLKVATIIHSSCYSENICAGAHKTHLPLLILLAALLRTLVSVAQVAPLSLILEKLCYSNVLNLPHCLGISHFDNGPPFVESVNCVGSHNSSVENPNAQRSSASNHMLKCAIKHGSNTPSPLNDHTLCPSVFPSVNTENWKWPTLDDHGSPSSTQQSCWLLFCYQVRASFSPTFQTRPSIWQATCSLLCYWIQWQCHCTQLTVNHLSITFVNSLWCEHYYSVD